MAHAYGNDGVTPNATTATFSILNRPSLKATTANGGYEQITLEVAAPVAGLTQGNVIRLTEVGGPFKGFVYGGIIESFPDTRSPTGTRHEIVVSPFGWELTRVATQLVYTTPTDVIQTVRDAVALTQHCSCDQVSVPPSTGIMLAQSGAVDYRGQKVNQVLDTARSILGPTWFWYCDELGRVWFQAQGSQPIYTLMGGQHYEERVANGGDIQNQINQVRVSGSPSGGSTPITAIYNGSSQSTIGIRALDPSIQLSNVSDSSLISAVAAGVGATLDQIWTRVQIKALPTFAQRVHGSQPGGAMVRYWEPTKNALPESAVGAGYIGPFICQSVEYDGLYQQIEAGSIPVTSQTDVDNLVRSLVARGAAISLNNAPVTTNISPSNPVGNQLFQVSDPTGQARLQIGNLPALGNSPADWMFRAIDSNNNPIFDSDGLISVMKQPSPAIHPGTNAAWSTASTAPISGSGFTPSSITFTLTRTTTMLFLGNLVAKCLNAGNTWQAGLSVDSTTSIDPDSSVPMFASDFSASPLILSLSLAKGAHTVYLMSQPTPVGGVYVQSGDLFAFQLGG